ncbi:hypothetical protein SmJEL517_g00605 [Synchytrium microbalum]|uniref:Anaphase-promoting complex subunit 4 WD40 domain-containing protein n=1 Tax=Synchytrium microbalum TaxID=1806994 RepID=A0A507CJ02_9FUNG|nr:uncharacterized protein SmJEL517_g00605 [Synchytrium microbalum]TPX37745.1 hypothetical protein SmJEL517_g00605 [Synchytrium microbalum]
MSLEQVSKFNAQHEDLIHDIAYDYYGKRLATCSSDHRIKVWDYDEAQDQWVFSDGIKEHEGSVLKVAWAHPEFGQIIASCSMDRTVKILEENETAPKLRWLRRATITTPACVQDLEFAPNFYGLKLATVSADGMLKIYEPADPANMGSWGTPTDQVELASGVKEPDGHFCLSWSPSRLQPMMLACGAGRDNAKIIRHDHTNKLVPCEVLPGHTDIVCDIAWAPHMGRSYQLIATGCKDGHVRIFKLTQEEANTRKLSAWQSATNAGGVGSGPGGMTGGVGGSAPSKRKGFKVEMIADFGDHNAEVWRVEWNVTGTILSSSGDDGMVRLWKATYLDEWRCMGIIGAEGS